MHRRFEGLHRDAGWLGVPAEFGNAAAILLGDLCLVWSDELLHASGLDPATLARARRVFDDMRTEVTVGQFLDELKAKADLKPKTLEGYAVAFRGIVADIFGIEGGKEKYDHRSGGRAKWIEKIHAIRLGAVTPERVQAWKPPLSPEPVRMRFASARRGPVLIRSCAAPRASLPRTPSNICRLRCQSRSRLRGSRSSPGSRGGTAQASTPVSSPKPRWLS